jgi:hypothetical protein|tara:strand:+ start:555 stop:953 length:399 start_codon:yes stop_codon:yes gene_type:complete
MNYTTKKIELTNDHFLAVTNLAEYTHEIFSDFKNSNFSKKYKNQPFPGQYLLFIAGGLAESYDKLFKDIYALIEIKNVKFSKPAFINDKVYLDAKLLRTTEKFYYFDWKVLNQNNELLLFCKVKFLRYSQQS